MGFLNWFGLNWFVFLQSAGIIGGLFFTAFSLRTDAKARQVSNLLAVGQHHREIWSQIILRPELRRVLKPEVDLARKPLRDEEETFVLELILHLYNVYQAMKDGMYLKPSGLRKDIHGFFSLPIPHVVWQRWKALQDKDFVQFVEDCRIAGSRDEFSGRRSPRDCPISS